MSTKNMEEPVKVAKKKIKRVSKPVIHGEKPYKVMVQFIRNKKRTPTGVMVAFLANESTINIGWSKCKMHEDYFDRGEGKLQAMERAMVPKIPKDGEESWIPHSAQKDLAYFAERARKYYKVDKVLVHGKGFLE